MCTSIIFQKTGTNCHTSVHSNYPYGDTKLVQFSNSPSLISWKGWNSGYSDLGSYQYWNYDNQKLSCLIWTLWFDNLDHLVPFYGMIYALLRYKHIKMSQYLKCHIWYSITLHNLEISAAVWYRNQIMILVIMALIILIPAKHICSERKLSK